MTADTDSGRELSELAADRALLGRTSTAERVAGILRERIAQGFFLPGVRLSEERIGNALGVSRNTLREAFRLLTHERLLVHRLNKGAFVRVLTAADIADIYRVRNLVECAAVRGLEEPPYPLEPVAAAVGGGRTRRRARASGTTAAPPTSTSTRRSPASPAASAPTT